MLLSTALTLALLVGQDPKPRFEDEIRAYEAADRATPPPKGAVLFLGSSSIRLWKSLKEDFPDYTVLNRGFGGSRIDDSVRLVDRIVVPYAPRAIVFFAGTNDIADGHSPETVEKDYRAFVTGVRRHFPRIPIAYVALSPAPSRWALQPKVRDANARIRAYSHATPGLRFIDIVPPMLTADFGPRPELFVGDQLHMNENGYAIWTKAVSATLRQMLPTRRQMLPTRR